MGNELAKIVADSGLESAKAEIILKQFEEYFSIAAEWEAKAKAIVVTREDQTADMKMARTGRLFLREKRIAVEKTRKKMKEESLREGKAIDGIANVLQALIVPIEEYLDKQEKFVINKRAEEARIKAEQEAKERREQEERERKEREAERKKETERLAAERKEKEKLQRSLQEMEAVGKRYEEKEEKKEKDSIRCPKCGHEFHLKD